MKIDLFAPITENEYHKIKDGCSLCDFYTRDLNLISRFFKSNYHIFNGHTLVTTGEGKIEIEKNNDYYFLVKRNSPGRNYYKCDSIEGLEELLHIICKF